MVSAIHTALSGLTAYAKQMEASAHNAGNVSRDEFKKCRTEFVEAEAGGMLPVVQKDDSAGPATLKTTA